MAYDQNFLVILVQIAGGVLLLYFGGEYLVKGGSHIARLLGMSPFVVGLTIVAFGTSLPEMVVSLVAAVQGRTTLSTGNIIGSNISNIGLIIGLSATLFSMTVVSTRIKRDLYILFGVSIIFTIMVLDNSIQRWEGIILFSGIIAYVFFNIISGKKNIGIDEEIGTLPKNTIYIIGGIIGLGVGSNIFVDGAVSLARMLFVSEFVIGLTIVALGTSLPELSTSLVAAYKQETDISVGNIIGSNVFNILAVIGLVSTIRPLSVEESAIRFELPVMLLFTVALFPLIKLTKGQLQIYGVILMISYVIFVVVLFLR